MNQDAPLPDRLRALRQKLNLSQEQLAARLDVSFATVNRWETGKGRPQAAQRDALERLFDEAGVDEVEPAPDAAPSGRRRRGVAHSAALSTKSMEQMLWDAACSIRGEKDAPKFKDYILPLVFLKRLSDVFDDEIARLAQTYGSAEAALEIADEDHEVVRFYMPPEARWGVLSGRQHFDWPDGKRPSSLGHHITTACRIVAKQNPTLDGVLNVVDFAATHNGERDVSDSALKGVVETLSDPRYRLGLKDVEPDFLGRCYEYLLRKFAEGSGQSAGEFYTPREVGMLMAEILAPNPGEECLDYACGSAGLLIKLQLAATARDPLSKVPLRLYGQELIRESFAIAWMNAIVHDMKVEIARGDSMRNPKFRDAKGKLKTFDIVTANPMWNQDVFERDVWIDDELDRFMPHGGATIASSADWAWLQHTMSCLNERGRAAVVLDTGAVTRGSGSKNENAERNIRKWFVDNDLIDGVILLPENLFYNTPSAGVIVVLNNKKPQARVGKIVLLNASRRVKKGKPKNYLPDTDIPIVAAMFANGSPVEGEVAIISAAQAAEADYNLSPSRWIEQHSTTQTGSIEQLLSQLQSLEKDLAASTSALQHLLNGVTDAAAALNEPPEDNDVRPTLRNWDTVAFDEALVIAQGQVDPKVEPYASMIHIGPENVESGTGHLLSCQTAREQGLISGKYLFDAGDIVYSKIRPYLNKVAMPEFAGLCSADMYPLKARENYDARFLFYYLLSDAFLRQIVRHQGRTGIPKVNREQLATTEFPHPDAEEQREIACVLDAIDRQIALQKKKQTVLEALFQTLLQKLMTGELRVTDFNLDALKNAQSEAA